MENTISSLRKFPIKSWLFSVIIICLGLFTSDLLAYRIEADFLDPNAMVFQVGRMVPGDLSDASGIDFQRIAPIFWMRVSEDRNSNDDPAEAILMVRLEVAGRRPIFTVSSKPVNIRRVLIPRGRLTNQQLALIPELAIGHGEQVTSDQLFPYIDGGMMREGSYILTVLLADPNLRVGDWDRAISNNYGIRSALIRTRNPSQVELTRPTNNDAISSNPIFTWRFPRGPGVQFRLELVSGDPGQDPATALDFANNQTRYLDKIITLRPGVSGELTSHAFTGIGEERPLERGKTYFWRVTAIAPSMFGKGVRYPSVPYTFSFGQEIPEEIALIAPANRDSLEVDPPVFQWRYSNNEVPRYFEIEVKTPQGQTYALIEAHYIFIREIEERSYTYGSGPEEELQDGDYLWKVTAIFETDGHERRLESEEWSFKYIGTSGQAHVFVFQGVDDLVIISPENRGYLDDSETPKFVWLCAEDVAADGFILEFFRREEEQPLIVITPEGEIVPAGSLFKTVALEGGHHREVVIEDIPRGEMLAWWVKASLEDGSEIESDASLFTYRITTGTPLVITLQVVYPGDGTTVHTDRPCFTWLKPQDKEVLRYVLKVFEGDEGRLLRDITIEEGEKMPLVLNRNHQIETGLPIGRDYSWMVIAELEDGSEISSMIHNFTIALPELILETPTNDIYTIDPTFEWSLSYTLPDDYSVSYSIIVEYRRSQIVRAKSPMQNWNYMGPDLRIDRTYTWGVEAIITFPDGSRETVSGHDSFTCRRAPEITLVEPENGASVQENPPQFTWSFNSDVTASRFILELFKQGEEELFMRRVLSGGLRRDVTLNTDLTLGESYRWRIIALLMGGQEIFSDFNSFTITSDDLIMDEIILYCPDPANGLYLDLLQPQFSWRFTDVPGIRFVLQIKNDDGEMFCDVEKHGLNMGTAWQWWHRLGEDVYDKPLQGDITFGEYRTTARYLWKVTAYYDLTGEEQVLESEERWFDFPGREPNWLFELINPIDEREISWVCPLFTWRFTQDKVSIERVPLKVFEGDGREPIKIFWVDTHSSDPWEWERYYIPEASDHLQFGKTYSWFLDLTSSATMPYSARSELATFTILEPEVALRLPKFASTSSTPTFTWLLSFPFPGDYNVEYVIEVKKVAVPKPQLVKRATVSDLQWHYNGPSLIENTNYTCQVTAKYTPPGGETQSVKSEVRSWTYTGQ
ncbi:MAG: hypothetical protein HQ568_12210 [Calditrichaeota bacterium]|nr:hypothetical protein [Calditrichota bacterium]